MKKYWSSINEFKEIPEDGKHDLLPDQNPVETILSNEIAETGTSRRDFLKFCGFGVSAAVLAASCEAPVKKAIPFLAKPEEITPGLANHFASTYIDGSDYCSVLVKTRDGRPIKIEGNEMSSITKGGTSARVQASVLSLYDSTRLQKPLSKGEPDTWKNIHNEIIANLQHISDKKNRIVLLTAPLISPSERQAVNEFTEKYPTAEVVVYEPASFSGILTANKNCFGIRAVPSYQLDNARLVVSFGADFLGSWLSPVEFTKQYAEARRLSDGGKEMLRHVQFESGMTLTGSNADERHPVKASQEGAILVNIYNAIADQAGAAQLPSTDTPVDIASLASELWNNKGNCLVVSGSNDISIQTIVNGINHLLGNYGHTIDFAHAYNLKQANDADMVQLVEDLNDNKIKGLIINKVNPAYDYFERDKFIAGLKNPDLSVTFADRINETGTHTEYVLPPGHYLESWGDAEPKKGVFSLMQPTIRKLFDTCSFLDCILAWTENEATAYDYIKGYWEEHLLPLQSETDDFTTFWSNSLQNGVFEPEVKITDETDNVETGINKTSTDIIRFVNDAADDLHDHDAEESHPEVTLYESIAMGNGTQANNPWLQEMDDPITKVAWDNVASVSVQYAEENHLSAGSIIKVGTIELPIIVQPGQANGTISVALGYGRTGAGKVGNRVGQNAYPLIQYRNGTFRYNNNNIDIVPTAKPVYPLALTQTHNSMEGRNIIKEATLSEYIENPAAGNEDHEKIQEELVTLYPEPKFPGHHWGLAVDLNACTGCGSCTIACQAENNVAVVGKEQVRKRRNMHWIRLDRYYSEHAENPEVTQIPVMCQQCDNAPCENVCPVAATMHSNEGINQMAYNRCIGTRYCMNNCPYKVRRFNWFSFVRNPEFDFNMNDDLGRMVLNPDVVVRSRGVVEKCSFCTQRIQEGKLNAKLDNRPLKDGDIKPACMQACPADAIVFGDLNDKDSKISKLFEDKRSYHLLEELHVLPSVAYMTKIRNTKEDNV